MKEVASENLVHGRQYRIKRNTEGSIPMLGTFVNHVLNPIGIRIPRFSNVNVNNLLPGRPRSVCYSWSHCDGSKNSYLF